MHNIRVSCLNLTSFDLLYTDSDLVICVFRQVINLCNKSLIEATCWKSQVLFWYIFNRQIGSLSLSEAANIFNKFQKKSEVLTS